jgi:hypothetical protein
MIRIGIQDFLMPILSAIFTRFEAKKTGFLLFFRIEADQRILRVKRMKTEVNIPF